ncbi:MAG: phosphoribosylaminoimidazolesuccinocarboxamide synthase [Spirochaetaceae bacterium]
MTDRIHAALNNTFSELDNSDNRLKGKLIKAKVRDIVDLGSTLVLTTSDRISAFDVVLGTIPFKGEVLNRLSLYWFKNTEDIIQNHIISGVSPRSIHVNKCQVLPIEVIVRGYLTGSAWRDYSNGNPVSGLTIPTGMKMDQKFETPLLTPSTKAEQGDHDQPISSVDIVKKGLVSKELWAQVEDVAFKLFERGTKLAAKRGLILVDTKYEFGLLDGKLVIIDEVHTPDSSRFWYQDSYSGSFEKGEQQKKVDKEFLRQWLIDQGFMGHGDAPELTTSMRVEVALKYIEAFELITGEKFVPSELSFEAEREKIIKYIENL